MEGESVSKEAPRQDSPVPSGLWDREGLGISCWGRSAWGRGAHPGAKGITENKAAPRPVCGQHPHKRCVALAHRHPRESPSGLTCHSIGPRERQADSQAPLLRLGSQETGLFEGCWNGGVGLLGSVDVWNALPKAHQAASSKDSLAEQPRPTKLPDQSPPLGFTHQEMWCPS